MGQDGFGEALARLRLQVESACAGEDEWSRQVAVGIRAALAFAMDDPTAAQVLTNNALAQGQRGYVEYDRMLEHFAEHLLPGRLLRPEGELLPEITEKLMVGGLASLIAQRLDFGRNAELPALAPEAIQFVLTPYLGSEGARKAAGY